MAACTLRHPSKKLRVASLLQSSIGEMVSGTSSQIPKIDFSGLDLAKPGTPEWDMVRAQLVEAIRCHGWFEAVYDKITPELRKAIFGSAIKEVFRLPVEVKSLNTSDKAHHGYIGRPPEYEGISVEGVHHHEGAQKFTNLMWPGGNPTFCNTLHLFGKQSSELEQIVRRMLLENLGVENYFDSQNEWMTYGLRMAYYAAPQSEETKISLVPHTDPTIMSIICQYQIEGLEISEKEEGEWISVMPSSNSFTFVIGEAFEAWTNGRLRPTNHRVTIRGHETRYSTILASYPKSGHMIQIPKELVDEEHPLLYKPFDYPAYIGFRYSEAGMRAGNALQAYCGVGSQEVKEA